MLLIFFHVTMSEQPSEIHMLDTESLSNHAKYI